jgi:hypothetical protein
MTIQIYTFVIFYVAHNIKYLKFIFCTFVRYITNYIWIYFHIFLKLKKYDFLLF